MPTDTAERAAPGELDRLLGDPLEPDAGLLAADERGEYFAELLAGYPIGADLVPTALGGRFTGPAGLVAVLRAVARHDLAMCLGGTAGSAAAALTVWACGTVAQQRVAADVLLANGVVAAPTRMFEPDGLRLHGADLGLVLDGCGPDLADAGTAGLFLLCARTGGPDRDRLVLVDPDLLPAQRFQRRDPVPTVGLRGVPFAAVETDECPIPADAVLPEAHAPVAYAALAARLLRPAVAIGTVDSALRIAMHYAASRWLNGRPVADLSYPRRILTEVFADLLLCDCLTTVGIRALATAPDTAGGYAAAADALVPRWLAGAVHRLSTVMGATFYLREGRFATFQKHLRDIDQAVLGTTDELGRWAALVDRVRAGLPQATGPADVTPRILARADRYGRVVAARACADLLAAHDGWLDGALVRLGFPTRATTTDPFGPLWTELVGRYERGLTFDLAARSIALNTRG
jgi:alkylation response protein AidB-like acyl-CoA dehydrogenase